MLNLKVESSDRERRVEVAGDIGLDAMEQFRHELLDAVSDATGVVTIDVSRVGYTHTAGLCALLELHALLRRCGGRMRIVGPQPAVRELFDLTALGGLVVSNQ